MELRGEEIRLVMNFNAIQDRFLPKVRILMRYVVHLAVLARGDNPLHPHVHPRLASGRGEVQPRPLAVLLRAVLIRGYVRCTHWSNGVLNRVHTQYYDLFRV